MFAKTLFWSPRLKGLSACVEAVKRHPYFDIVLILLKSLENHNLFITLLLGSIA